MRRLKDKSINISGQIFGELKVISKGQTDKLGAAHWLCQCSCGNKLEVRSNNLRTGHTKSCGDKTYHQICDKHPHFKGFGKLGLHYFNQVRKAARLRNIDFNITIEDAWNLFVKQNGKCALSNIEIEIPRSKKRSSASIDRIDSSKDYSIENIQWVHKTVNKMKMALPQEIFVDFCRKIAENVPI